ncbi:hypothetical protein BH11PSE4_BH11PSE4_25430 [soil metagenome]
MAANKQTRPVKSPARGKVARSVVKKPVKKTLKGAKKPAKQVASKIAKKSVKKAVTKKPAAAPLKSGRTKPGIAAASTKTTASVRARQDTMDKTLRFPGDGDLVTDPDDHAANRKFERIRRTTAVDKLTHPPVAAGAALIERVSNAVERELLQIETIVGGNRVQPGQRTEAERRARTLASLARTLAEVRRLRAAEEPQRPADGPSAARDLEAFRRILWKRLEGMVGRTTPFPPDGNEPGGNG